MRVGYADPPYPGRSTRLYRGHPDFAGEVDSAALVDELVETFEAFALHTTTTALRELLPRCPAETRVLAWVKPWASWKPNRSPAFAWEPVLIYGHRRRGDADKVRDYLAHSATRELGFQGAKPRAVALWVFAAMGLEPEDELVDLYPGTGAVGEAWRDYCAQSRLDLRAAAVPQLELEAEA